MRYHKTDDKSVVKAIVHHYGIALRSRDGSLLACSGQTEKDTVVKNWCGKKLGLDAAECSKSVNDVCAEMKGDRFKNRVTFSYLVAKNTRKLSALK